MLVHGARPQIDRALRQAGQVPRVEQGLRVTDRAALQCVKAAVGALRVALPVPLQQAFDYLPPEGTWNLWNMLLLRVPIGVGAGSLLVWAGMRRSRVAGDSTRHRVQLVADRVAG